MSLYHEAAEILSASHEGGSLKSRVFRRKNARAPLNQLYALVFETCKWSAVLKEVIDGCDILRHERKLTPTLALLLVHDLLLVKGGIALPQSHGLRACIDRHKGRLHSELTRARIRRKASSLEQLKRLVDEEAAAAGGEEGEVNRHPRWIRINALKSSLEEQLDSTFRAFTRVFSIEELMTSSGTADSNGSSSSSRSSNRILLDAHVPNLVAIPPGYDMSKTEAYAAGKIIFQDKASCFPAYLLDVRSEDGDVVDACAAPGNKTTHLAAIVHAHTPAEFESTPQTIFAFEKDAQRAKTLEKMVRVAGAKNMVRIGLGQDFLQTDPMADTFKNVGALLLDPSCSGSGIVGRDAMPKLHLPQDHHPAPRSRAQSQTRTQGAAAAAAAAAKEDHAPSRSSKKRKLEQTTDQNHHSVLLDDDGNEAVLLKTREELQQRLEALSSFQLALLLHAFRFPGARKITYSTCSVHTQENEHVVTAALRSDTARERGWRILRRDEQVSGMKAWPVRGLAEACAGDGDAAIVADGCIRAHKDDGRGVMGFFVAGFVRDVSLAGTEEEEGDEGPYVRDENGGIVRDVLGMPTLKATGHPVALVPREDRAADAAGVSESTEEEDEEEEEDEKDGDSEWGGFDD